VFYHHRRRLDLVRPSILLLVLLTLQITLGAYTVLTEKHYVINSLHVVTGASVLVTSLVLALRAHYFRIVGRLPPELGATEGGPAGRFRPASATGGARA
jgi:heme A synthase